MSDTAGDSTGAKGPVERLTNRARRDLSVPGQILLLSLGILVVVSLIWVGIGINAARLFVSILTPLVVVGLGYLFNRRLTAYQHERQERREERERKWKRRIEFTMEANIHGPEQGSYLIEFVMNAHNKGDTRKVFEWIELTVLGLEPGAEPSFRDGRDFEVNFSEELVKTNVLPEEKERRGWFVEPGVNQQFTFVTAIEADYEYILAIAKFEYGGTDLEPHTTKRTFAMEPART